MKNVQYTPEDLQAYVDHIVKDYNGTGTSEFVITFEEGQKYTRVVATSYGSRSSHSFLDAQGNIWKCASWKAPAKNFTRGNIITRDFSRIRWTGAL